MPIARQIGVRMGLGNRLDISVRTRSRCYDLTWTTRPVSDPSEFTPGKIAVTNQESSHLLLLRFSKSNPTAVNLGQSSVSAPRWHPQPPRAGVPSQPATAMAQISDTTGQECQWGTWTSGCPRVRSGGGATASPLFPEGPTPVLSGRTVVAVSCRGSLGRVAEGRHRMDTPVFLC